MPGVYKATDTRDSERRGWLTRAAPTGAFSMLEHGALTERLIGLAIGVHEIVGPGVFESVYQECLCLELREAGIAFESQVIVPVVQSPTGIILSKTKEESSSVGISPDWNMVREQPRESA